jgi:hypothetical protein
MHSIRLVQSRSFRRLKLRNYSKLPKSNKPSEEDYDDLSEDVKYFLTVIPFSHSLRRMEGDFPEFEALKDKLDREYQDNPDVMLNEKGKVERSQEYAYTRPKQAWQNPKFQEWKQKQRVCLFSLLSFSLIRRNKWKRRRSI